MTKSNEICELSDSELETVAGGGFIDAAMGALGNVVYDIIKTESANGCVANLVRMTGNTPK